jgi:hypothetical protein
VQITGAVGGAAFREEGSSAVPEARRVPGSAGEGAHPKGWNVADEVAKDLLNGARGSLESQGAKGTASYCEAG